MFILPIACKEVENQKASNKRIVVGSMIDLNSVRIIRPEFSNKILLEFISEKELDCFSDISEQSKPETTLISIACDRNSFGSKIFL